MYIRNGKNYCILFTGYFQSTTVVPCLGLKSAKEPDEEKIYTYPL